MVLGFLAVDNFDFTRKIVKKNWVKKLVKMLGFCQRIEFSSRFKWDDPEPIPESHYAALTIKLDCKIRKRGQPAIVKWYKNDQEITDKSNRT